MVHLRCSFTQRGAVLAPLDASALWYRDSVDSAATAGAPKPAGKAMKACRSAPKKALNPYLVFLRNHEPQVRADNPEKTNTQITHILAKMWKNVSDEERVRMPPPPAHSCSSNGMHGMPRWCRMLLVKSSPRMNRGCVMRV